MAQLLHSLLLMGGPCRIEFDDVGLGKRMSPSTRHLQTILKCWRRLVRPLSKRNRLMVGFFHRRFLSE